MDIDKLAKVGGDFHASRGSGNFGMKLKGATRYGELHNLSDNVDGVLSAVKKYELPIKRGGLSRGQMIGAIKLVKKSESDLTKRDLAGVKKIFAGFKKSHQQELMELEKERLNSKKIAEAKKIGAQSAKKTAEALTKPVRINNNLTEKQKRLNVFMSSRSAEEIRKKSGSHAVSLSQGQTGGLAGSGNSGGFGSDKRELGVGFASGKTKISPAGPKGPLGGIKPIGL